MDKKKLLISSKLGFFLATREVRRNNPWTTFLIIFVMTLTFLNLIVVRGILVGLTEGSSKSLREQYTGDILLTAIEGQNYIQQSSEIITLAQSLPQVEKITSRYVSNGTAEAGYRTKIKKDDKANSTKAIIAGINPLEEENVTGLSKKIIKGRMLDSKRNNEVVIGASLLSKYTSAQVQGTDTLKDADVGSVIQLTINGSSREVIIVGVLRAKVSAIDNRIFITDRELRQWTNRNDYNVNEIALKLKPEEDPDKVKEIFLGNDVEKFVKIQTWEEAQPQFVKDINQTFNILGNVIGSIGLTVSSITIFIVIFINAITRRKFIGILKGIGVNSLAIEISYVLQSIFYAVGGTGIGLLIIYGILVPYFNANPIQFPFSDGILVADVPSVGIRTLMLYIATIFAGYIPARIVVKQKTLDAILGR